MKHLCQNAANNSVDHAILANPYPVPGGSTQIAHFQQSLRPLRERFSPA
jgi:hypothetical protein